jgi:hypothetical protein
MWRVALGFAVGLIALEAALRAVDMRPGEAGPPRYVTESDPGLGFRLRPNHTWGVATSELQFRVETNAQGFRGSAWNASRPAIAVLGSSGAFGWGVDNDDTFAAVLQLALTGHEVRNFGVFGYNKHQIEKLLALRLQREGPPKAVILVLSWLTEDLSVRDSAFATVEGYFVEVGRFPGGRVSLPYRIYGLLFHHSRLGAVMIDRLRRALRSGAAPGASQALPSDAETAARIAVHAAAIRAMVPGTPLGVVLNEDRPAEAQRYQALMTALDAAGIEVLPTRDAMFAATQPVRFLSDGHWSAPGHRVIAQVAAGWLRTREIR